MKPNSREIFLNGDMTFVKILQLNFLSIVVQLNNLAKVIHSSWMSRVRQSKHVSGPFSCPTMIMKRAKMHQRNL